ncbi:MAG: UDP-2,4-diacetamido-2,4,6-trideoxy-beta-L-altropyranose hydrolase [Betaproteobacteria bacterium]
MSVVFRCNAGPSIGLGHLTRCRALAHALCEQGQQCVMVGPDLIYATPTDDQIFEDWIPVSDWSSSTEDASKLIAIAQHYRAEWLVLDDYRIDEIYQLAVRAAGLRWLQFDGTANKPLWADVVVNANPAVQVDDYCAVLRNRNAQLLLGPQYAILRPEFASVERRAPGRRVKKILITFGGGDDRGANEFVLTTLVPKTPTEIQFSVVSGASNPNNERLENWINSLGGGRVDLHINPESVADLFVSCDLAVIAGGTTTYEAAYCALPMILVTIADNQINQSNAWASLGAAVNLGALDDVNPLNLIKNINAILDDELKRKNMAIRGACLVNGCGSSDAAAFTVNFFSRI